MRLISKLFYLFPASPITSVGSALLKLFELPYKCEAETLVVSYLLGSIAALKFVVFPLHTRR
jgi:hypothetical protein